MFSESIRVELPFSLTHCTLTGVDQPCKGRLDEIISLSKEFPFVEWGFLFSPKHQGTPGRYPSVDFIKSAFKTLPPNVRVALHVCGVGVDVLLSPQNFRGDVGDDLACLTDLLMARRNGRLQLNFNQIRKPIDMTLLRQFLSNHPYLPVITQVNKANYAVWRELRDISNHMLLSDSSGGRGIVSDSYPSAGIFDQIRVGYAGGLSADNLIGILPKIDAAAGGRETWIDMEGSLRKLNQQQVDCFDLDECRRVLEVVHQYLAKHTQTQESKPYSM